MSHSRSLPNCYRNPLSLTLLILGHAVLANAQSLDQGRNPACSSLSAVSVPGDIDFGNSLAHEFITCESLSCRVPGALGCERQPFLCVPDSWRKSEIQEDFQDRHHQRFFL